MFSKTPAIAEAGPVTFAAIPPPGATRRALILDNTSVGCHSQGLYEVDIQILVDP